MLVYCDESSWKEDVEISVYDDNIGGDAVIGTTKLSLLPMMNPQIGINSLAKDESASAESMSHTLLHKGKTAGELRFGAKFLPAGRLTIKCVSGRNLRDTDSVGKSDPYLQLSVTSQIKPHGGERAKRASLEEGRH